MEEVFLRDGDFKRRVVSGLGEGAAFLRGEACDSRGGNVQSCSGNKEQVLFNCC